MLDRLKMDIEEELTDVMKAMDENKEEKEDKKSKSETECQK
jgi:hypothetical protein